MDDDDNRIEWNRLSPAAQAILHTIAEQRGVVLDTTSEAASEITAEAMGRLQAEAQRRGVSIYEVVEALARKSTA